MKLTRVEIENQNKRLEIRRTIEGICKLEKFTIEDVFYSDIEVYEKEGTNLTWHTHMNSERPVWATDDNRASYEIKCAINVKR